MEDSLSKQRQQTKYSSKNKLEKKTKRLSEKAENELAQRKRQIASDEQIDCIEASDSSVNHNNDDDSDEGNNSDESSDDSSDDDIPEDQEYVSNVYSRIKPNKIISINFPKHFIHKRVWNIRS